VERVKWELHLLLLLHSVISTAVLFILVFLRRATRGKEIATASFCVFPFPSAPVKGGEVS